MQWWALLVDVELALHLDKPGGLPTGIKHHETVQVEHMMAVENNAEPT